MTYGPEIVGKLVRLVPLDESMAEKFFSWINSPEVNFFRPSPLVESVEAEREWIRNIGQSEHDIVWAVFCQEDGELIGSAGLHQLNREHRRAVTGSLIGLPEYWGRGLAGEMVRLRTAYAFEKLDLRKLISDVAHGNNASLRMLMRVGYRIVGLFRDHYFRDGEWLDFYLLECLRRDWEQARAQFTG